METWWNRNVGSPRPQIVMRKIKFIVLYRVTGAVCGSLMRSLWSPCSYLIKLLIFIPLRFNNDKMLLMVTVSQNAYKCAQAWNCDNIGKPGYICTNSGSMSSFSILFPGLILNKSYSTTTCVTPYLSIRLRERRGKVTWSIDHEHCKLTDSTNGLANLHSRRVIAYMRTLYLRFTPATIRDIRLAVGPLVELHIPRPTYQSAGLDIGHGGHPNRFKGIARRIRVVFHPATYKGIDTGFPNSQGAMLVE